MKKVIYIFVGLILFIVFFNQPKKEELRVRVIANSDTVIDQEIKYQVASIVMETINNIAPSKNNLENDIEKNMALLESKIKNCLSQNNVLSDGFSIKIAKEKFPPKTMDNTVVPGGVYKTLVVKIGDAEGKNWWSLLYPDFFNCSYEDINSGDIEYKSFFVDKIKKIFN